MLPKQDKDGNRLPAGGFAILVPEFSVKDIDISRRFWCDLLGFSIAYARPENRFIYLERAGAQVMLNQHNGNWETGALDPPLGRGVNFQITVADIAPMIATLVRANWPLFKGPGDDWYRTGDQESGNRQFLVQDPDGYLLRFTQDLGRRPLTTAP